MTDRSVCMYELRALGYGVFPSFPLRTVRSRYWYFCSMEKCCTYNTIGVMKSYRYNDNDNYNYNCDLQSVKLRISGSNHDGMK